MTRTPWGDSEELRGRMLRPGRRLPRAEVQANQRERLFGATVACVAERGYEATTVAGLCRLSGVSRSDFYELFVDKRACLEATIEAIIELAISYSAAGTAAPAPWERRAERGFEAFARLVAGQPAAARVCLLDAYAAGPEVVAKLEQAIGGFEALVGELLVASPERAGMPGSMISGFVGTMTEIARTRLRRGSESRLEAEVPELRELMLSYRPPPGPLRLGGRPPAQGPERIEGHDHAERALRAFAAVVAERGYPETTVDEVVARGRMSASTFYAHFAGKEDAMAAAIRGGGAQILAAALPAAERAGTWPEGVGAALGAYLTYLASRPSLAMLFEVEIYAAGPAALERRDVALAPLASLLGAGPDPAAGRGGQAVEVALGTLHSLVHRRLREPGGAGSLPALTPLVTYVALAPRLGAATAYAVAGEERRGAARRRRGR